MQQNQYNDKLTSWALEHKKEWEIICGIRISGIDTNLKILEMVKDAGFKELRDMIVYRIYYCMYEDLPESQKDISILRDSVSSQDIL
jgi:hypothetical protein